MKLTHAIPITIPTFLIGILALMLVVSVTRAPAAYAGDVLDVPADYPTIQLAVEAAGPGDIIQVAAGTYNENVEITTSDIRLKGKGAVIDGTGLTVADEDSFGIYVLGASDSEKVSGVHISGFVVQKFEVGIVLEYVQNSRINQNEVRENVTASFPLPGDSEEKTKQNGIDLINSGHNWVTNNYSHHNGHNGITLKGGDSSSNNIIRGNVSSDNGTQRLIDNDGNPTKPAGCGIQLSRDGNNDNSIIANETNDNAFGILLSGKNNANPDAGSTGNVVNQNRVHGNSRAGIDVRDGSSDNNIGQNNATGNSFHATGATFDLNDQGDLDNTWRNNQGIFGQS